MAEDESKSSPKKPLARISPQGKMINQLHTRDPKLAAEEALRVFLRPPRRLPNARERSYLDMATKSSIQIDNIPIQTYAWSPTPQAASVLISHGYGMNAASMSMNWVPPLFDAGFCVISWDQVAHGESGGDWGDVRVFMHTVKALALQNRPLAGIIGVSLGATAALMTLAENPSIECPRLVCLSPPTQMDTVSGDFLRRHGCSEHLVPEMKRLLVERNALSPEDVRSMLERNRLESTKVLVVQDRHDRVATIADAKYLADACVDTEIKSTEGLGHYGCLKNKDVIRLATSFVIDGNTNGSTKPSKL